MNYPGNKIAETWHTNERTQIGATMADGRALLAYVQRSSRKPYNVTCTMSRRAQVKCGVFCFTVTFLRHLTKQNNRDTITIMTIMQNTKQNSTRPNSEVLYVTPQRLAEVLLMGTTKIHKRTAQSQKRALKPVPDLRDNEFWDKGESL